MQKKLNLLLLMAFFLVPFASAIQPFGIIVEQYTQDEIEFFCSGGSSFWEVSEEGADTSPSFDSIQQNAIVCDIIPSSESGSKFLYAKGVAVFPNSVKIENDAISGFASSSIAFCKKGLYDNVCIITDSNGNPVKTSSTLSGERFVEINGKDFPLIKESTTATVDIIIATPLNEEDVLAQKIAEIEELRGEIILMAEQINLLAETVDEKTAIINTIELELSEQTAIIDALNLDLAQKEQLISNLETTNDQKAQVINNLNIELNEKTALIQALFSNLDDQIAAIALLETTIEEKANIINQLNLNLNEQAQLISGLEENVQEQADIINAVFSFNSMFRLLITCAFWSLVVSKFDINCSFS